MEAFYNLNEADFSSELHLENKYMINVVKVFQRGSAMIFRVTRTMKRGRYVWRNREWREGRRRDMAWGDLLPLRRGKGADFFGKPFFELQSFVHRLHGFCETPYNTYLIFVSLKQFPF